MLQIYILLVLITLKKQRLEGACVCVCVCVCMRACMCACVRACVYVYMGEYVSHILTCIKVLMMSNHHYSVHSSSSGPGWREARGRGRTQVLR